MKWKKGEHAHIQHVQTYTKHHIKFQTGFYKISVFFKKKKI